MGKGKRMNLLTKKPRKFMLGIAILFLISTIVLLLFIGVEVLSISTTASFVELRTVRGRSFMESRVFLKSPIIADGLGERGEQWTEILSWEPRATLYHNFLSKEECEYLISLAKPHVTKSWVVDNKTGKSRDSGVRTSSGTFLRRGQDKVVRAIEERIARFTHIPVEHGEGLQILNYGPGQKYDPHHDYFSDEYNVKNGGNRRMATVLMYLSDVEEGGETVFPAAKGNISAVPWWNLLSKCGKRGLAVKPKMGDAVLFWSMKPDATLDPTSLHGACPVIKGSKWAAPKWLHVGEYKI